MKKVVGFFIIFSLLFSVIGFSIDWRSYVSNFENLPNIFEKISTLWNTLNSNMGEFPNFSETVTDFASFFKYVGDFFTYVGSFIGNCAIMVVYVPYIILSYLIQLIICVLGFGSIKVLEVI